MESVWIWPHNRMTNKVSYDFAGFEKFFNELYKPYKCLYFSRGRVAIAKCLSFVGGGRSNLVFVQPYSSHCVLSAVSKVCTPVTIHPKESDYQIIYHNFGHKNIVDRNVYKNILIEDSVDSLITTNDENELFPNDGRFAVLSLSKLFRIPFGAICVCHNGIDYDVLRELRNQSHMFNNDENHLIETSPFSDVIIDNQSKLVVNGWNYEKVKNEFAAVYDTIKSNINLVNNRLKYTIFDIKENRFPSNLIFKNFNDVKRLYDEVSVEVKERHIYNYNIEKSENIYLYPVHIGNKNTLIR